MWLKVSLKIFHNYWIMRTVFQRFCAKKKNLLFPDNLLGKVLAMVSLSSTEDFVSDCKQNIIFLFEFFLIVVRLTKAASQYLLKEPHLLTFHSKISWL